MSIDSITPEASKAFLKYEWPGNIRELENVIERAILLASMEGHSSVKLEHVLTILSDSSSGPINGTNDDQNVNLKDYLDNCEKKLITEVLIKANGSKKLAARCLESIYRRSIKRLINIVYKNTTTDLIIQ